MRISALCLLILISSLTAERTLFDSEEFKAGGF